eukprot:TRINITY_DN2916_c0_g1_i1.p1 TRINITY_DN2916_c0_g1~~TRINITY_DN2916_c0_g1_i1.p1  ORF type:complete len:402 (+),score=87.51 TRINITY_DN2916_c0_g1_i1:74-1279(+)
MVTEETQRDEERFVPLVEIDGSDREEEGDTILNLKEEEEKEESDRNSRSSHDKANEVTSEVPQEDDERQEEEEEEQPGQEHLPPVITSMSFVAVNIALISSQLLFGGWHVIGYWALSGENKVNPVVFALIREGIAGPLLLLCAYLLDSHCKPHKADLLRFVSLGATGVWGNQLFFILGLNATNPTYAAIMQPSIPVFAVAIALVLQRERFNVWKIGGILSAAIGAVIMVLFTSSSNNGDSSVASYGIIFLIINCLCMAIYLILQKPMLAKYSPLTVTAWAYVIGSVMMAFTSLIYANEASAWVVKPQAWIALTYSIFLSTMLSYFLIAWAHQRTSSTLVAVYNTVQPVSAAFFSFLFLGFVPTWNQGVGALFVFLGLGFVTWQKYQEDKSPLIALPSSTRR